MIYLTRKNKTVACIVYFLEQNYCEIGVENAVAKNTLFSSKKPVVSNVFAAAKCTLQLATHHKYSDEERRGGETLFAAREHHEGQEIVVWSLKAFAGLLVFSLKLKNVFDFRNWQDPGPSVNCHPLHDFCGLPKRDFIISAVMTPSLRASSATRLKMGVAFGISLSSSILQLQSF